jgi:hypothetical protein
MSERYKTRPSQLLGIEDEYWAWCADEAVWLYGVGVENEMSAAAKDSKTADAKHQMRSMVLQRHLARGDHKAMAERAEQSGFRDPANMFKRG